MNAKYDKKKEAKEDSGTTLPDTPQVNGKG